MSINDPNLVPGLLAAVPRRVRMSPGIRQTHFLFLSVILGFGLTIFCCVWLLNHFFFVKPLSELQARGEKAEGKVTNIRSTRVRGGGDRYDADFQFPVASGGTASGSFGTGFGHTQIGQAVPVIYLPEDPSQYVVAHEITSDHFRSEEAEHKFGDQAAIALGGGFSALMSLILLPGLCSDLRKVRFARWAELVIGRAETVTATGYTYTCELPDFGKVESEEQRFASEKIIVGQQIPILYLRRNPKRRKPVSSLSNVEFLPPKE